MSYNNNNQQAPFWDFVRSFDGQQHGPRGAGVDHPAAFGYGPPPEAFGFGPGFFGPHDESHGPRGPHPYGHHGPGFGWGSRGGRGGFGPRGRHGRCRRGEDEERSGDEQVREPATENENEKSGDPETSVPSEGDTWEGQRGGRHHGGRGGHGHGRGHRGGPPPFSFGGPGGQGSFGNFDFSALLNSLSQHPLAQAFRNFAEQQQAGGQDRSATADTDPENTFTPPIDIFSTPAAYILHISLPGAKKEDVGVNWDADKSELNIAGVVYRQGDEEFLKTLSKSERKVGVFERTVKLPPGADEKEEVDGDAISAKLEDGVLVVTVPKVEKDWTEVKKVDIE